MLVKNLKELKVEDPTYAKELLEGYQNQRKFFFDRRMIEINKSYKLSSNHEKTLWGYLLAAEQPKNEAETKEFHILDSMSLINIEEELFEKKPFLYGDLRMDVLTKTYPEHPFLFILFHLIAFMKSKMMLI